MSPKAHKIPDVNSSYMYELLCDSATIGDIVVINIYKRL